MPIRTVGRDSAQVVDGPRETIISPRSPESVIPFHLFPLLLTCIRGVAGFVPGPESSHKGHDPGKPQIL
jgi:hypothetical protein